MYQYIKKLEPLTEIKYFLHEGKQHGLEDLINQIREEKEREDGEKIQRRRYFTIDEIEKYKSSIEKKDYDYTDKSYFEYIDMKFY